MCKDGFRWERRGSCQDRAAPGCIPSTGEWRWAFSLLCCRARRGKRIWAWPKLWLVGLVSGVLSYLWNPSLAIRMGQSPGWLACIPGIYCTHKQPWQRQKGCKLWTYKASALRPRWSRRHTHKKKKKCVAAGCSQSPLVAVCQHRSICVDSHDSDQGQLHWVGKGTEEFSSSPGTRTAPSQVQRLPVLVDRHKSSEKCSMVSTCPSTLWHPPGGSSAPRGRADICSDPDAHRLAGALDFTIGSNLSFRPWSCKDHYKDGF